MLGKYAPGGDWWKNHFKDKLNNNLSYQLRQAKKEGRKN